MTTVPAAIVLAAGEGRRMGGPKALLVLDGEPLVSSHVARLREVGCRTIVVVVRHEVAAEVRLLLADISEARVVCAETDSMAASLTVGLESVCMDSSQPIIVAPVDALPVSRSTLDALLKAVMVDPVQVATPRYRNRSGHPIVARGGLLQVFLQQYSGTLRDLLRSAEAQRRWVDVDDAAVGHDLDTPADLAAVRPGAVPSFA
jgi:CTP:molybdopterin cytidylyltransferase MocA